MNKILSIIIPFYKESELDILPLLSTIATQKGIDFSKIEVLLVNDGYEDLSFNPSFFNLFKNLEIQLLRMKENKGPGIARQYGLDNAQGKYVMFCDCDDVLHNVGILGAMLEEIELIQGEFLSTSWLEEYVENNVIKFINHFRETTWLHGKMFLRQFLIENKIKFHTNLRVHEDTYFLSLVNDLAIKKQYLETTSYIWTYNPNSVTRSNNAIYSFNSMGIFVYAVTESIKELIKRNELNCVNYKVVQLICYIYLITQSKEWRIVESQEYLESMENSLIENMRELWVFWENSTNDYISKIYFEEFTKCQRDFTEITLQDWVSKLRA